MVRKDKLNRVAMSEFHPNACPACGHPSVLMYEEGRHWYRFSCDACPLAWEERHTSCTVGVGHVQVRVIR